MTFVNSETYKASEIYMRCPFCGKKDHLMIHRDILSDDHGNFDSRYSIRCERCDLLFGVDGLGSPQFESESDLIAEWNVRKY